MDRDWQAFLAEQGAVIESGRVVHYGTPPDRAVPPEQGCIMADLSHWGVIGVAGEDAASFLQGQLTADIQAVTPDRGRISGYCSPKGRLLASFYVFRHADAYCLCLPAELVDPVIARLNIFKLRARVELQDMDGAWLRIGLAGTGCEPALAAAVGSVPGADFATVHRDAVTAVRLPGPGPRFLVAGGPADIRRLWSEAARTAVPVGASSWELLEIRAAIPMIRPQTQEKFVPQMVNLDALEGIGFNKGCYTGQEIVARTHYLGKLKRRMYRLHCPAVEPPSPATPIYNSEQRSDESVGSVIAAQAAPEGGTALLAVLQTEATAHGELRLGGVDGPACTLQILPYDSELPED